MNRPSLQLATERVAADEVACTEARSPRIDARPILARSGDSLIHKADEAIDAVHRELSVICADENIEALLIKSPPLQAPPWVKLEVWLPRASEFTQRSCITVHANQRPFHDLPIEYTLVYTSRGHTVKVERLTCIEPGDLRALVDHQLRGDAAPNLKRHVVRDHPFKFWRPRNECRQVRPDWLFLVAVVATLAWLGALVASFAGADTPSSPVWQLLGNPVAMGALFLLAGISAIGVAATPTLRHVPWRWLALVGFAVALAIELLFQHAPESIGEAGSGLALLAAGAGLASGVIALTALGRRIQLTRSVARPEGNPRDLRRVDSWQAVVWGAGADQGLIRERLLQQLEGAPMPGLRQHGERIWYWGIDGLEEREQLVLAFRRGLLFCHIYQYGADLYVGWDAHVNLGVWTEKKLLTGIDRIERVPVIYNTLEPGVQGPSEYDVVDVSCLLEWMHAQITQILKRYLAERQIDQEIDFTIIRGERQRLDQGGTTDAAKPAESGRRRFRRAA